jgi:hypothetical protein
MRKKERAQHRVLRTPASEMAQGDFTIVVSTFKNRCARRTDRCPCRKIVLRRQVACLRQVVPLRRTCSVPRSFDASASASGEMHALCQRQEPRKSSYLASSAMFERTDVVRQNVYMRQGCPTSEKDIRRVRRALPVITQSWYGPPRSSEREWRIENGKSRVLLPRSVSILKSQFSVPLKAQSSLSPTVMGILAARTLGRMPPMKPRMSA